MYNLSTSRETSITINGTMPGDLVIYGDKIVWADYFVNPNIYLYDLPTSKQTQITTSGAAASPAIYGDKIFWMDSRKDGKGINMESPGNWNIYMYNISTSEENQLFSNESIKMFPAIYEDKIVWMDSHNGGSGNYWNLSGNWDIYMYNLSTRKETQITTDETLQMYPAIYGNIIVWIDSCNGNGKIYAYNLTTSKETAISNVSWKYDHPSIYGNRIVWMDFRNGSWEIYMFDLSTSKETQVTTNSSNSQSPANPEIYGNRIVWNNWLNDANGTQLSDVYLYTVSGMETGSNTEQQSDKEKSKRVTGFELANCIACLLCVFLFRRK
jgi:beta propeller repeat protein